MYFIVRAVTGNRLSIYSSTQALEGVGVGVAEGNTRQNSESHCLARAAAAMISATRRPGPPLTLLLTHLLTVAQPV